MASKKVAQGQSRSKNDELARELRSVAGSLQSALGDIVEAFGDEDPQAFVEALRKVNSARVVLDGEAAKLLEVQS